WRCFSRASSIRAVTSRTTSASSFLLTVGGILVWSELTNRQTRSILSDPAGGRQGSPHRKEPPVKITDVRTIPLRGATHDTGWPGGTDPNEQMNTLLEIRTDEGLTGIGSCFTSLPFVE